jgi:hypothetical protein
MNDREEFGREELEVIGAAELKAQALGHDLGPWHRVDSRTIISVCNNCDYIAFVTRPRGESWHVGEVVEADQCRARG